jgi:hypothetical protein
MLDTHASHAQSSLAGRAGACDDGAMTDGEFAE